MKRPTPTAQISPRRTLQAMLLLVFCGLAMPGIAAEPTSLSKLTPTGEVPTKNGLSLRFDKSYALGVNHYQLDHKTKVTGWRMGERWFLGRQRGLDSGLTLVWQQHTNQISLSKDGVRFTRRF